jgi:excisionase family DNA binding protein
MSARPTAAKLRSFFAPELVEALERLVDERVAQALAGHSDHSKRWLNVAEAGALLGCTAKAVYARIDRGRIPASAVRRMGRTVLIDRQALDRALDR